MTAPRPRQTAAHVAALRDGDPIHGVRYPRRRPVRAADAKARAIVRLPNGKTGRLIFVPARRKARNNKHRAKGRKARVQLASGRVCSVLPEALELVGEES